MESLINKVDELNIQDSEIKDIIQPSEKKDNNDEEETNRKLASVQIIRDIKEHTNSDNLALAQVLGWQVIIKKDEVKVGQKIIYFEIDSLLTPKEWNEFLAPRKYRVKTIKLRGEISQGLILPLTILGDLYTKEEDYLEGQNLTKLIGVKKYEIDSDESTNIGWKGNKIKEVKVSSFPSIFIEKTDEPRIQSEPQLLLKFIGKPFYSTLKIDGTSATYVINPDDGEFFICSRNQRREYTAEDLYTQIAVQYNIEQKLKDHKLRYAIQGEIYGPKIQTNPLGIKAVKFAVFNIKDLKEDRYLNMEELVAKCKEMDLPMVDIIEKGDNFNYSIEDIKKASKGDYPGTKYPREGLVFRLQEEWHNFGRNSFKIINDDFLLKRAGKD